MFNPISASKNIRDEFIGYISTHFNISNKEYAELFLKALNEEGAVSKGPYLDINDSFKTGLKLKDLISEGEISPLFEGLEGDIKDGEKEIQINRKLYLHQEQAIRKINQNKNLIVTTGTGSGKTECFIIPIINRLLREAEEGRLDCGVRAILIYPMNALANDQMKRLRKLLKNYPDITFGIYNSSTKQTEQDGVNEYKRIFKNPNGYSAEPLENEMLSRERMQKTPPHILITNYAMLEYMLLRPKDDAVFSGAKLKFLVLDEAHVYHGTMGMETSLLIKRLKARISEPKNVLHILTSATLGGKEADDNIVKFAETLCSAEFNKEDIIRSQTITPSYNKEAIDLPMELFADLAEPKKPLNDIAEEYGLKIPEGMNDSEFLYELCTNFSVYRRLRKELVKPMTVPEITSILKKYYKIEAQDVINIINAAAQASKNNMPLIKARYHMFAKALEGVYITLGKDKRLMLNRTDKICINGEERKVFECAVCDDCGRLAVVGRITNGILEMSSEPDSEKNSEYYFISDKQDADLYSGDIDEETSEEIEIGDYRICTKCGAVVSESLKSHLPCDCGIENYIRVKKATKPGANNKNNFSGGKCPNCARGKFVKFYLGYDASTAVLGTSLYEELPETEKILKSKTRDEAPKKSLFGSFKKAPQAEIIKKQRQFLSFSDNRGEAAFFASYMTKSYSEFLRRRGIWHVVENNKEDMARNPWEISHFVDELTSYFDSCRTFAEPGERGNENLTAVSRKNAWIAVLNEMVNSRKSTGLPALGLIRFNYKGNSTDMSGAAEYYGKSEKDIKALFDLLAVEIINFGAIEGSCELTDVEREYIYFTSGKRRIKLCKDSDKDKNKPYIMSWMSFYRKNGNLQKNGRLNRVVKTLGIDEKEANELLKDYWENILCGEYALTSGEDGEFYFKTDKFTISAGTEDVPVYICDTCGKTTMTNCMDMCITLKCGGKLKKISHDELLKNHHYADLYRSSLMKPLHIKEHTAQLGRDEQQKYQEMFINKDINALSCSTTFEMGVDVGDLETVFLRDMPPSPANYVQRAGRTGRGINAAAFSLTYAKLGSHDFTYYKHPENMITGKIGVPLFTVKNEKVIKRHIFAVALSDFFAQNADVYNSNDADVLLNGNGYERLCDYLNSKPEHLKRIIKASVPEDMHEAMGISDFSWIELLTGEDGALKIAVDEFRQTVKYYENQISEMTKTGDLQAAARAEKNLKAYRRGKADNHYKNDLIEFLARNNVLPKYGFPVDTAELYQNINNSSDKKLQMVRDLQLAISEYAPDAQVVADGKLYTSRYIRKLPQTTGKNWKTVYVAQCRNSACKTWNHRIVEPGAEGEECVSCHQIIKSCFWDKAIEPRRGFIAEATPKDVPMHKPDKAYRSDDFYIGDEHRKDTQKFVFKTEGERRIFIETSSNDSLMVVCNDNFFVCPLCGYSESFSKNKKEKSIHSRTPALKKTHITPWGKKCESNVLKKYKLCHVFKTDVVRIFFESSMSSDLETMLSVMYALLEAMSSVMDIERNDIKGCLHKIIYKGELIYSIVLYDAVAGGAGHVKRLTENEGGKLSMVIKKAVEITEGCKCHPSCYGCLRNYYNQKIHDKLNRVSACNFLKNYIGDIGTVE